MLVLVAGVHAGGQSQPAKASAPVQTPDGQPDIQGFWAGRAPGAFYHLEDGLNDPTETELIPRLGSAKPAASQKPASPPPAYKSIIVDPPTGKVPYQPWAAAKRKDVLDLQGVERQSAVHRYECPLFRAGCAALADAETA